MINLKKDGFPPASLLFLLKGVAKPNFFFFLPANCNRLILEDLKALYLPARAPRDVYMWFSFFYLVTFSWSLE